MDAYNVKFTLGKTDISYTFNVMARNADEAVRVAEKKMLDSSYISKAYKLELVSNGVLIAKHPELKESRQTSEAASA